MKVIFLDIDGVINSEDFAIWNNEHPEFCENGGHFWIDPNKINMIIKLCEETGAKIVISSSWRGWSLKDTLNDFSRYRDLSKLNPYIIGITPRFYKNRGIEIQYYLDSNISITNYCIIDDDSDMLDSQKNNFVKINYKTGLTEYDVEKIKNILSN